MVKIVLFLIGLSVLLLFLNFKALTSYFSQDDFFHLRVIQQKYISDIPSFFLSKQKEYGFYRPLSRETYNLTMYKLFGLNPLPFHISNYLLIVSLMILVFLIVNRLCDGIYIGMIASLIFSISSIHSVELYYLSSVQTLLATNFMLLSIYTFLLSKKGLPIIFFILGLMSHEGAIMLVVLISGLLIFERINFKTKFFKAIPYLFVTLTYLLLTKASLSLPAEQVYSPVFSFKTILNSLGWYIGWSFNLPEFLTDFVGSGLKLNSNFIKWYPLYFKVTTVAMFLLVTSLLVLIIRYKHGLRNKVFVFFILAFTFSIAPFLFFPQHKFIYYLSFAYPWFCAGLAYVLSMAAGKIRLFSAIFILSFLTTALFTINLYKFTYWAAKRAEAAKVIISSVKQKYPDVEKGTIFYIDNDPNYPDIAKQWGGSSKQASYILSGSDAFKLIYNDPNLKVYFQDIELPPIGVKTLVYTAKFPY